MIESLENKSLKSLPKLAQVDADIEATKEQLETLKNLRKLVARVEGGKAVDDAK